MYAKVDNGQVAQVGLPSSGMLSNGQSVSNYDLLSESVLLSEGWLPYEENKPEYNSEIQELKLSGYTIESNKVIGNYEAVTKAPSLESRVDALEGVVMDMLI